MQYVEAGKHDTDSMLTFRGAILDLFQKWLQASASGWPKVRKKMLKYRRTILFATVAGFGISGVAIAQTSEPQAPAIVVEAPSGLTEKQQREWDKLNCEAQQLEKRLATLRARILDDREEVSEAQRRLERAQAKLDREEEDLNRTQSRIEDAEKDRSRIEKKRIDLLAGR